MRKVLIANRGEIACRIIRSCRTLGIPTVAVYSEADKDSVHVASADEAVEIGPAAAKQSYLVEANIIEAAKASSADAIHPGYGFLAENARFAEVVEQAGLIWIGPRPSTIEDMGDKERARDIARAAGVPVLPGSPRFPVGDLAGLEEAAEEVGYPLLAKASGGGGGIGMKLVEGPETLREMVEKTQALAEKAFGDGTIYLERFVPKARHIEIQVFGFGDGHAIHLYERDCSIQRRFQKVIEESPAPGLPDVIRQKMATAAVSLAHHERYRGAGTIEGRVYAENPAVKFVPSPGPLEVFRPPPETDGVRVDTGVREGGQITIHYDPMIAKVVAHGSTRNEAADKLSKALADFKIEGVKTNIPFLIRVLGHDAFRAGSVHTHFIDQYSKDLTS